MQTILSKEIPLVKAILQMKANSGCPAMTGIPVPGTRTENTITCQGLAGQGACKNCDIKNRVARHDRVS